MIKNNYLCYVKDFKYFVQEEIRKSPLKIQYHSYSYWKNWDLFIDVDIYDNMKIYLIFIQDDGLHVLIGW